MKLKNQLEITARPWEEKDTKAAVSLIHRNFREVNSKDYSEETIKKLLASHDEAWFRNLASFSHVFTFWAREQLGGVGSIAGYWGSVTESILLTVFVLPELHGQGLGRYIIQTLEQDPFFLRAKRVEIPASVTAVDFYRKMGYGYKDGFPGLDEEQHYRLEKFKLPTTGAPAPSGEVSLCRAVPRDAKELHAMQVAAFRGLLEKYQDYSTNPASEGVEKVSLRLRQESTCYYFIYLGDQRAGALRVVDQKDGSRKRISPLFVLPKFRRQGIAQKAIQICEAIHGEQHWELDTILQEPGNCRLYEKMGYRKTGGTKAINENMTLVFYEK